MSRRDIGSGSSRWRTCGCGGVHGIGRLPGPDRGRGGRSSGSRRRSGSKASPRRTGAGPTGSSPVLVAVVAGTGSGGCRIPRGCRWSRSGFPTTAVAATAPPWPPPSITPVPIRPPLSTTERREELLSTAVAAGGNGGNGAVRLWRLICKCKSGGVRASLVDPVQRGRNPRPHDGADDGDKDDEDDSPRSSGRPTSRMGRRSLRVPLTRGTIGLGGRGGSGSTRGKLAFLHVEAGAALELRLPPHGNQGEVEFRGTNEPCCGPSRRVPISSR